MRDACVLRIVYRSWRRVLGLFRVVSIAPLGSTFVLREEGGGSDRAIADALPCDCVRRRYVGVVFRE